MSNKNVNPKIALKLFKVVCQYDSRVACERLVPVWSLPYLLLGYCVICVTYILLNILRTFSLEKRARWYVRELYVKTRQEEKTSWTATTLQLLTGEGKSKDCLRNQEFALTQRNPNKNHQHQIRNALSYVERNQLLI